MGHLLSDPCQGSGNIAKEEGEDGEEGEKRRRRRQEGEKKGRRRGEAEEEEKEEFSSQRTGKSIMKYCLLDKA